MKVVIVTSSSNGSWILDSGPGPLAVLGSEPFGQLLLLRRDFGRHVMRFLAELLQAFPALFLVAVNPSIDGGARSPEDAGSQGGAAIVGDIEFNDCSTDG